MDPQVRIFIASNRAFKQMTKDKIHLGRMNQKIVPNPDVAHIRNSFFEGNSTFWKISIPNRLLLTILIMLAAKLVGAAVVYGLLDIQTSATLWFDINRVFKWDQNTVFLQNASTAARWSYTFVGWDSAWYLSIMTRGYGFSPDSYAFPPGLPLSGLLFDLFFKNPVVSGAVCSLVFGVLWLPCFQLVAERYMSKQAAFGSTLLFAFSPYVFLFTTLVYAEGLFLFFTLSAWYLFKTGKRLSTFWLAAASALSRVTGFVLILPMLLESLKEKTKRKVYSVILSLGPLFAFSFWMVYLKLTTNDFLPFLHVTEWSSIYTIPTLLLMGLPKEGFNIFQTVFQNYAAPLNWLTPYALVFALIVPPFLIYLLARIEKSLAAYALVYYLGVIASGGLASIPRYLSVLFPLWMPLAARLSMGKKSIVFLGVALAVSFMISLSMWVDFLNGVFVA